VAGLTLKQLENTILGINAQDADILRFASDLEIKKTSQVSVIKCKPEILNSNLQSVTGDQVLLLRQRHI